MAFHIEKPSALNPQVPVYYVKSNHWTDIKEDRKTWKTKTSPTKLILNPDGTNGGWEKAKIVKE